MPSDARIEDIKRRFEQSFVDEKRCNDELVTHKPERDVYGELICVRCKDAAPCPRARGLMSQIYEAVRLRINARARGYVQ